ncbi:alpha/beta fold hydrolase [Paraherbaspirillum soli]|uniref:Alpha/beta fold hydrolase n=1 Tax=Paraherbaspirillum soli TaxID=631222 RepID=A0ABW0M6R5_9BURK
MRPLPSKILVTLASLSASVVLTACGDSHDFPPKPPLVPEDPLQSYRKQSIDWQQCDATVFGYDPVNNPNAVPKPKEYASCANIRVPLDYANLAKGDASIGVVRVYARTPAARAGAILFNPGGPGGDGIALAPMFADLWEKPSSDDSDTQATNALRDRYDLIGFSPRGVGASSRLYCASNEYLKPVFNQIDDRSAENIGKMRYNAELTASACKKNPIVAYINTEQTARDVDMIRSVLGDDKLNYLGFSYGTWLGAWYAGLFPEHVGRMVLDGNMNFAATTFDEGGVVVQPPSLQRIFDNILGEYAARHPDIFNLGDNPGVTRAVLDSLQPDLKSALIGEIGDSLSDPDIANRNVMRVTAANGLKQLIDANPEADIEQLEQLVLAYPFTSSQAFNAYSNLNDEMAARYLALRMLEPYFRNKGKGVGPNENKPLVLPPETAVFQTVVCNDTPRISTDPGFWLNMGNKYAADYPVGTNSNVTASPCNHWSKPTTSKPSITAIANTFSPLMVQTQFDGQTATEPAMKAFDALPKASLVFVKNEYQHGSYPHETACVDRKVIDYLLNGALPERRTDCDGKPLALDVPVPSSRNLKPKTADPEQAERQRVIQKIHDLYRRNAIKF